MSLVEDACHRAKAMGLEMAAQCGVGLTHNDRQRIVRAFRRGLFPAKPRGRRKKETITAAHRDWLAGVRGVELYSSHIPGWQTHSLWRRRAEARGLLDAIQSRERRARRRAPKISSA